MDIHRATTAEELIWGAIYTLMNEESSMPTHHSVATDLQSKILAEMRGSQSVCMLIIGVGFARFSIGANLLDVGRDTLRWKGESRAINSSVESQSTGATYNPAYVL